MFLRMLPHGYEGVILVRVQMMIWWISKDDNKYFGDVAVMDQVLKPVPRDVNSV